MPVFQLALRNHDFFPVWHLCSMQSSPQPNHMKSTHSSTTRFALLAAATLGIGASHAALTLNFDIDHAGGPNTYSGVGVAPDTGTMWNSVAVTQNATGDITVNDVSDSEGNGTTIDLVMNRNGGESHKINNQTSNGNPNPSALMSDYVYWDTWNITVSGLAPGDYDLYAMGHGDAIDQTNTITWGLNSASTTQDLADFRDIFQAGAEGNTFTKLSGTVDGSGVLSFTSSSGLNGFQIQAVPEPGIALLGGLGLLGLLRRRR